MAHVIQNKKKLLARISRIRGQINGIEKALNEERECGEVLLTLAACRGVMNALMARCQGCGFSRPRWMSHLAGNRHHDLSGERCH